MNAIAPKFAENLVAVILADGRATRMGGGYKALAQLHSRPLLEWILERLRPQASLLAISANGDPERFLSFNVPVIPDAKEGFDIGPTARLLAGLGWASQLVTNPRWLLIVPCDAPFPPSDVASRLVHGAEYEAVPEP